MAYSLRLLSFQINSIRMYKKINSVVRTIQNIFKAYASEHYYVTNDFFSISTYMDVRTFDVIKLLKADDIFYCIS